MDTLSEWSDGDDEWIWDVDYEWEFNDDINRNVQDGEGEKRKNNEEPEPEQDWEFSDSGANDIIRNSDVNRHSMDTLGEWSDGDDEWIWDVDYEWEFNDDINRNVQDGEGEKRKNNEEAEPEQDWEFSDSEADDIIRNVQIGEGQKRKNNEEPEPEQDFYVKESVRKHMSKKFSMTATDHTIRFINNMVNNFDLIESHERTYQIFEHLLSDVTEGMDEKDQVRFVLRSEQLETPISIPFLPLARLTPERVFSAVQRVMQSNREFRLNDTVTVDLIHVEASQGSGKSKRNVVNIKEYLHKKGSVIVIRNNDNLCLARALVVAIAKVEKAPNYVQLRDADRAQEKKARELHAAANVPLGPCGIEEVKLFQKHLTSYEINIISGNHNNAIIYPLEHSDNVTPIYLYLHDNHYDIITSMPGFLNRTFFCLKCRKGYSNKFDHLCPGMCKSCRFYECIVNDPLTCDECNRWFRSRACYDCHKVQVNGTKSICQTIKKCQKCGKSVDVRKLRGHICGKKCSTCRIVLENGEIEHKCYIQKTEQSEDSKYNQLLFFDFECKQETGKHEPNLCIVHDEKGREELFEGSDTTKKFCEWLFSKEHQGCIVVAHNFQGYDGYFIHDFLNKNAIKYKVILRGAKILSMTIPMFDMKFIDSLNFIPMSLSQFPKTFGMTELCKGYFPHLFNKEENQSYVGPIPPVPYYSPNTMKPKAREAFLAWHKEQVENNYVFDFRNEIIKYCRSDVDILRKCCMEFREMLRDKTNGIDPFEDCLTIASYCHKVYRTNFMKKDSIAVFPHHRQLKMKQSIMAMKWLSYEMEKNGIHIQHVRNGGEKRVGKYSLDGYCEERNTVYEFQGCFWHGK